MMDCRKFFKIYSIGIITIILGFLSCTNASGPNEQVYSGEALGTTFSLKFFHPEELELENELDSIFRVINNSMSTYQEGSDISRINSGDTTISVDENFRKVFLASEKIYLESDGYFDPTVGNLVNAYGFGPESGYEALEANQIDSLMQFVGFNKLELTEQNRIIKEKEGIYLDFNAIAKGFTVDVIAAMLDQKGVKNYLIEVGGELVAKGINKGKEQPWIIAIDDPLQTKENRTLQATLFLKDRAMATSGNYRKFRIDSVTGQNYVHTINPISGKSERNNLLSVSVLAENCMLADGYATAFLARGFEKSKEMLEKLENVDVYFVYTDPSGEVKVFTSEGFEEVLTEI